MYPCLIQRLCTSGCDQFVQMVLEHSPLLMRYCQTLCIQFTTLKPVADRVLVKIQAAEEKTTAGILLPSTAVSKPQGGEVVAVGEGRLIGEKKIEVSLEVCCTLHIYIHCSFFLFIRCKVKCFYSPSFTYQCTTMPRVFLANVTHARHPTCNLQSLTSHMCIYII